MSVKCPSCGREVSIKPLKMWKFRFYDVRRVRYIQTHSIIHDLSENLDDANK